MGKRREDEAWVEGWEGLKPGGEEDVEGQK